MTGKSPSSRNLPHLSEMTLALTDDWQPSPVSIRELKGNLALLVSGDAAVDAAVEGVLSAAYRFTTVAARLLGGESRAAVQSYLNTLDVTLSAAEQACAALKKEFHFGLDVPDRARLMLSAIDPTFFPPLAPAFSRDDFNLDDEADTAAFESAEAFRGRRENALDLIGTWAHEKRAIVMQALAEFSLPGQRDQDPNRDLALSAARQWDWLCREHGARGSRDEFLEVVHAFVVANGHDVAELESLINIVRHHKPKKATTQEAP